jgi:hypothetical protein
MGLSSLHRSCLGRPRETDRGPGGEKAGRETDAFGERTATIGGGGGRRGQLGGRRVQAERWREAGGGWSVGRGGGRCGSHLPFLGGHPQRTRMIIISST